MPAKRRPPDGRTAGIAATALRTDRSVDACESPASQATGPDLEDPVLTREHGSKPRDDSVRGRRSAVVPVDNRYRCRFDGRGQLELHSRVVAAEQGLGNERAGALDRRCSEIGGPNNSAALQRSSSGPACAGAAVRQSGDDPRSGRPIRPTPCPRHPIVPFVDAVRMSHRSDRTAR